LFLKEIWLILINMDYAEYLQSLLKQKKVLLLELNKNKGFIVDVEKSDGLLFLGFVEYQIKICEHKIKLNYFIDPKIDG